MRLLIFQHAERDSHNSLSAWITERGHDALTLKAWEISDLVDASRFDAVIILGGTMNVHDEHAFLAAERDFIRAYHGEVPILGICLGAQQIAHALGASVVPNALGKEVGVGSVALTAAGLRHPLFAGFEKEVRVFHWHGYEFSLPRGAEHLASSERCVNQAFALGSTAGVQFHLEVTPDLIREVYREERDSLVALPEFNETEFFESLDQSAAVLREQCFRLLDNFARYTSRV